MSQAVGGAEAQGGATSGSASGGAAPRAPRIAPGRIRELGAVNWLICRALSRLAGVREAKLFTTLGRHRSLFRGWLAFAGHLMPGGALSRRDSELAILRVAHLRGCAYELAHHRRLGRRAGLDDAALDRVLVGPAAPGWTAAQRALLEAVDALVGQRSIDDARWAALREQYGEREAIEVCLLVGHYEMLATTIAALAISVDV